MKISIIIPAYNVADYITTCLDSIESQFYQEVEVIIVDDGSSDQTARVVKDYQQSHSLKLILLRQANQGVQVARQKGLEVASGDYVLWMDSDDWLNPNSLQRLNEIACQSTADLICFDYQFVRSDGQIRPSSLHLEELNNESLISCLLNGALNGALWNKLIKREFLMENQIVLPKDLRYGEDLASLFLIALSNPTVSVIRDILYNYYLRPSSVSNTKGTSIYTLSKSLNYVRKLLNAQPEYKQELDLFLYLHLYYYRVVIECDAQVRSYFKDEWKKQNISMKKNPLFYRFIMKLSLKEKIKFFKYLLLIARK